MKALVHHRLTLHLTAIGIALFVAIPGCGRDTSRKDRSFTTNTVLTSNGPIYSAAEEAGEVHVFKGIRYGAPPVGNLRFKPPIRPTPWSKPAAATAYGNRAMQGTGAPPGASENEPAMSEDCLFLNVWTPGTDDAKRPVMVWLHGGGFSSGSGGDAFCEGKNLARKGDVVVVTVNHRLNAFGFLQLGDAWGPQYASSGQAGMLDIVLCLEWVRDNIARFGGDPHNVTIFGESGGGRKVAMLMAMPSASGLFHKAVIQSGSGLDAPSKADAVELGRVLLENLGIEEGDIVSLVGADSKKILDAQPGMNSPLSPPSPAPGQLTVPTGGFAPCMDGIVLQRKPFIPDAPAISAGIPLLIGSNKDEMSIFLSSDPKFGTYTEREFEDYVHRVMPARAAKLIPALRAAFPEYSPTDLIVSTDSMKGYWAATLMQAARKAEQKGAPVYVYMLAWETRADNGRLRAHHALDVPLVFDNVEAMRSMVGPGSEPQRMADIMSASWIAFARTGNPNTTGVPDWPEYSVEQRETMVFDDECRVEKDPYAEIRRILMP